MRCPENYEWWSNVKAIRRMDDHLLEALQGKVCVLLDDNISRGSSVHDALHFYLDPILPLHPFLSK